MSEPLHQKSILILTIALSLLAIGTLGLVLWQTYAMDQRATMFNERIQRDYTASNTLKQNTNTQTPIIKTNGQVSIPEAPESHIKLPHDSITFLFDEAKADENTNCTNIAKLAGLNRNEYILAKNDPSILEKEAVVAHMQEIASDDADAMLAKMKAAPFTDRRIDLVCYMDGDLWISAATDLQSAQFYKWQVSQSDDQSFEPQSPGIETAELNYDLLNISGWIYIQSMSTDADVTSWKFYQYDEVAKYFDLVEQCQLGSVINAVTGAVSTKKELICSREYKLQ